MHDEANCFFKKTRQPPSGPPGAIWGHQLGGGRGPRKTMQRQGPLIWSCQKKYKRDTEIPHIASGSGNDWGENTPSLQVVPAQGAVQLQWYVVPRRVHAPPWKHGLGKHTSTAGGRGKVGSMACWTLCSTKKNSTVLTVQINYPAAVDAGLILYGTALNKLSMQNWMG